MALICFSICFSGELCFVEGELVTPTQARFIVLREQDDYVVNKLILVLFATPGARSLLSLANV